MKAVDIIVIAFVAAWAVFAVVYLIRARKKGHCSCGGCAGNCAACKSCQRKEK